MYRWNFLTSFVIAAAWGLFNLRYAAIRCYVSSWNVVFYFYVKSNEKYQTVIRNHRLWGRNTFRICTIHFWLNSCLFEFLFSTKVCTLQPKKVTKVAALVKTEMKEAPKNMKRGKASCQDVNYAKRKNCSQSSKVVVVFRNGFSSMNHT